MKTITKLSIALLLGIIISSCTQQAPVESYEPDWQSLTRHQTPEWLQKGKFGIYTHWGIYAVHAYGENTTWYSFAMYRDDGEARQHFEEKFGELTPEYGYKDLIQGRWLSIMMDLPCGIRNGQNGMPPPWDRNVIS